MNINNKKGTFKNAKEISSLALKLRRQEKGNSGFCNIYAGEQKAKSSCIIIK